MQAHCTAPRTPRRCLTSFPKRSTRDRKHIKTNFGHTLRRSGLLIGLRKGGDIIASFDLPALQLSALRTRSRFGGEAPSKSGQSSRLVHYRRWQPLSSNLMVSAANAETSAGPLSLEALKAHLAANPSPASKPRCAPARVNCKSMPLLMPTSRTCSDRRACTFSGAIMWGAIPWPHPLPLYFQILSFVVLCLCDELAEVAPLKLFR